MPKTEAKLEDYKVLATIGTGNFGVCRKVKRKSDRKVFVWKEIDYGGMSEREKQLLVQEVNLLRELRHNHIVRYHDRIISKEESTLYIVMEYCEGGDLAALIAKSRQEKKLLEEDFVWRVFHQLLLALQECHRQRRGVHKVLHRDLKPANVFLDGLGQVKLGDFGLARILHHNFSLARTFVGTPYYMSPEQLQEQSYDEKSDLWSLGCLLYELCTLAPPFTAPNQKILSTKIRAGYFKRIPQLYSEDLHVCIASLLQTEPVMRPDIPSLLEKVEPHIMPTPKAPSHLSDLSTKEGRLQQKQKELLKKDVELKEKEATLSKWERQLAAWERALQERERQLKRRYNKVRPVKE